MDWRTTSTILERLHDFDDAGAWGRLLERFRPAVVGFARRSGVGAAAAEDIAQETLVAFAEQYRAGRYDPARGRLGQWLFGIGWRQILRARRTAARHHEQDVATSDWDAFPDEAGARVLWEDEWERAIIGECMEQARREFDPRIMNIFDHVVRDERAAVDVAAALGEDVKAVYNARARVLRRLRQLRASFENPAEPESNAGASGESPATDEVS